MHAWAILSSQNAQNLLKITNHAYIPLFHPLSTKHFKDSESSDCISKSNAIHFTLKMTSSQVVKTSVTNSIFFKNYTRLGDFTRQSTDTPGFKPCTICLNQGCHKVFIEWSS